MSSSPTAIAVDPAQYFYGNEGSFSTFALQVGNPPQLIAVHPSSSGDAVWAVDANLGCYNWTSGAPFSNKAACLTSRGGVYNSSASASYHQVSGFYQFPATETELSIEKEWRSTNQTQFGEDKVIYGGGSASSSNSLDGQSIFSYFGIRQPWVGQFGLTRYGIHLDGQTERNSSLFNLASQSVIGSMSWGYTAGAAYQNPQQFGSLVLGGFDSSRGQGNQGTPFAVGSTARDLIVTINNINVDGSSIALAQPALIDSAVSQLYLPPEACQKFESAFGLTYDNTTGYYLVDDATHTTNVNQNKKVTFTLAQNSSSPTVDITFPYGAFDQSLSFPLANITDFTTKKRFFPLQPMTDPNNYTLGRTFLQQAYVAVDYSTGGAGTFWVSPAQFPSGVSTSVQCIGCSSPGPNKLSGGAIAGIVIGVVAAIALIIGAFFGYRYRQKKRLNALAPELFSPRRPSFGGETLNEQPNMAESTTNVEYFKPPAPPGQEEVKPELDGDQHPRTYHRHELSGDTGMNGRRTSDFSTISKNTYSPHMSMSQMSPMDYPSTAGSQASSPPLTSRHLSDQYFELAGGRNDMETISELGGSNVGGASSVGGGLLTSPHEESIQEHGDVAESSTHASHSAAGYTSTASHHATTTTTTTTTTSSSTAHGMSATTTGPVSESAMSDLNQGTANHE